MQVVVLILILEIQAEEDDRLARRRLLAIPNVFLSLPLEGRNDSAEDYLKKCADLIPEWAVSHAALGIFYYVTGQVAKVRETLNRYMELSPQGGLNVKRIQEILASTSVSETPILRSEAPLP